MTEEKNLLSEKEIRKKKLVKNARKWLSVATDTADILATISSKRPTVLGCVSVGLKLLNSYEVVTNKESESANFFVESGWKPFDIKEFKKFIYNVMQYSLKPEMVDSGNDENANTHMIFDLGDDVKIGFVKDAEDSIQGPFAQDVDQKNLILAKLGRLVWEYLDTKNVCLVVKRGTYDDYGREEVTFEADDLETNVFKSETAEELIVATNLFLDKDYNRSTMFYGEPGTGKTSAMKYIAKSMGKHSLRINVADLNSYSESLVFAVTLLSPTILMIDDFDRAYRHEQMLTDIEKINQNIKLFMVSANDLSDMPGAILRPGRFDDIVEFTKLDDEILEKLIGNDVDEDIKERLKELPIAYISEFHKRKVVLGIEKAIEGVEELESRMEKAKSGGPAEDDEWIDDE